MEPTRAWPGEEQGPAVLRGRAPCSLLAQLLLTAVPGVVLPLRGADGSVTSTGDAAACTKPALRRCQAKHTLHQTVGHVQRKDGKPPENITSQLRAQTSWAALPLRSLPKHQGGTRRLLEKPQLRAVLEWKGRETPSTCPAATACCTVDGVPLTPTSPTERYLTGGHNILLGNSSSSPLPLCQR